MLRSAENGGGFGVIDPTGTHALSMTNTGVASLVRLADGQTAYDLPIERFINWGMMFSADGQLMLNLFDETGLAFSGTTLDGRPQDVPIEEFLPYVHAVHSMNGEVLGNADPFFSTVYKGDDLPRGVALYDFVWALLPSEFKEDINGNRVGK